LNDNGGNNNNKEEFVVEEVFKDVVFFILELSCVNLVEDLEKHEDIEEDRVMLSSFAVPFLNSNRRGNSKDFRA
jgi:hypothetical protein